MNPFRGGLAGMVTHVSLRSRITALVMVAVGVSVALASIAAFITVRNQIMSQLDSGLSTTASAIGPQVSPDPRVEINLGSYFTTLGTRMTRVYADGTSGTSGNAFVPDDVAGEIAPSASDYAVAAGTADDDHRTVRTSTGQVMRAVTVPIRPGVAIILAQPMAATQQTLSRLSLVSILVGIAGIVMAGSAGIAVGRAGIRPVDRLTAATEYVARTGDLRPIEVRGKDELARLATSFNSMLSALATSREHQRRLIADAGHELRTPLTSMRTNIDLLAQIYSSGAAGQISDEDRDELIGDVRAQMAELSELVGDLVELSRDVRPSVATEPVNLQDVVSRAVERVKRRAPNVTWDSHTEPWFLSGDSATLERAVTNLLDNAAKWSPDGGAVSVQLHDGLFQVADEGPGIAEADLPHVFERFYRSTEARTMPGSGLGLAIVRQAAENHGGGVAAARAPGGGALLRLWLPGRPGETATPDAVVGSTT